MSENNAQQTAATRSLCLIRPRPRTAPSHYGLLPITFEMASLPFLDPCREILRMIGARLVGDAEIGAQERGSEFRDQLLHRVGLVAKALAELAIAAGRRARPMGLMPISA